MEAKELKDVLKDVKQKHFLLEHIVSGAMAASIPSRSMRYAFARATEAGTVTGTTVSDVVAAVKDMWVENRGLKHSVHFGSFRMVFMEEMEDHNKKKWAAGREGKGRE